MRRASRPRVAVAVGPRSRWRGCWNACDCRIQPNPATPSHSSSPSLRTLREATPQSDELTTPAGHASFKSQWNRLARGIPRAWLLRSERRRRRRRVGPISISTNGRMIVVAERRPAGEDPRIIRAAIIAMAERLNQHRPRRSMPALSLPWGMASQSCCSNSPPAAPVPQPCRISALGRAKYGCSIKASRRRKYGVHANMNSNADRRVAGGPVRRLPAITPQASKLPLDTPLHDLPAAMDRLARRIRCPGYYGSGGRQARCAVGLSASKQWEHDHLAQRGCAAKAQAA